jgi:uncharacterized protein (DUF1800 family)
MAVDATRRVIDRATWGWTPQLESEVRSLGWERWLDQQLAPSSIPDPEVDQMLAGYVTLGASNDENYRRSANEGQDALVRGEIRQATVLRQVHSKRQLHEVMVDFWTNHFNTYLFDSSSNSCLKTDNDRDVARPHALGRFVDILIADAKNPGMLVYLDNWLSSSRSTRGVNENFARETLELHTLGILDGVQPYGQSDVEGLANVLSGFSITPLTSTDCRYFYNAAYHAPIPVSLLGGAWSTPGRSGDASEQDGISALTFLARRPETARHLAWRLCRRFVADDPPDALVAQLAQVYLANDTQIAPVLRALFHSAAFFASGAKYRRGLEALVASMRATGAALDPAPTGPGASSVTTHLSRVGQPLFSKASPDGYPDTRAEWLSSEGSLKRWSWNGSLTRNGITGIAVDATTLMGTPQPATGGALVDRLAARILGTIVSDPGFRDVSGSHAFAKEIAWMNDAGISTGYTDGTYRPSAPVTRAAMSAFLYRAQGEPAFTPPATPTFRDVGTGNPFFAEIEWMASEQISTGYPDGTYRPDDRVTRQAMSAFLYRAQGEPAFTTPATATFRDVGTGHPFFHEVEWMAAAGISTGSLPGPVFKPNDAVSRSAMSAFLFRMVKPALPTALPAADRAALVTFVGGEDVAVTTNVLTNKLTDLVALLLSSPTFQHR